MPMICGCARGAREEKEEAERNEEGMRNTKTSITATALALACLLAGVVLPTARAQGERQLGRQAVSVVRQQSTANTQPPRSEGMPHGTFRVEKRRCPPARETCNEVAPYETREALNAYTNAGGALLLDLLIGAGGTNLAPASASRAVGDTTPATPATMRDFQGATKKTRAPACK